MAWQFNPSEAVFVQIARRLRNDVLSGKYLPDEQFPSVRQLAEDVAVNPNTVQKALMLLEQEGILCTRGTVGRFVTSDISVIESARTRMQREAVKRLLSETRALGITKDDLIKYIEEEDGENE